MVYNSTLRAILGSKSRKSKIVEAREKFGILIKKCTLDELRLLSFAYKKGARICFKN